MRKVIKDKTERGHRRTWRHPECVALMANADFGAVEPLTVAMGLETAEEYAARNRPQADRPTPGGPEGVAP